MLLAPACWCHARKAHKSSAEGAVAGFPESYSKHRTKAEKASAERDHAALKRIYGILARLREDTQSGANLAYHPLEKGSI